MIDPARQATTTDAESLQSATDRTNPFRPDTSSENILRHGDSCPSPNEDNMTTFTGIPLQFGAIGVNRHVENFCIFYTNLTFSCKTNCVNSDDELIIKSFPDRPDMFYSDMNCSDDVPTNGQQWSPSNGTSFCSQDFDYFRYKLNDCRIDNEGVYTVEPQ
jgi:hypothetical protein